MTYWQDAVGLNFNPSKNCDVTEIKRLFSEIIDKLNDLREATNSWEQKRVYSVAITEAQTAQMWSVKGLTFWFTK